ncbi:hypothetical protein [Blastochloris sulfoviridis]|nr:hypothetical protein [Blastochloris sulfoviridis]
MIRAILFDVDGTLVDTSTAENEAVAEFLIGEPALSHLDPAAFLAT